MIRFACATLIVFLLGTGWSHATPVELQGLIKADRPVGCSEYSFMFWDLYEAELWSDDAALPGEKFGLSLTYLSDFTRESLVESSVEEMSRISGRDERSFAEARAQMQKVFRDVAPGDRITAWRAGADELRLFVNGSETGAMSRDVDLFLAIWLGETTRHPKGRKDLLAGRCDG